VAVEDDGAELDEDEDDDDRAEAAARADSGVEEEGPPDTMSASLVLGAVE